MVPSSTPEHARRGRGERGLHRGYHSRWCLRSRRMEKWGNDVLPFLTKMIRKSTASQFHDQGHLEKDGDDGHLQTYDVMAMESGGSHQWSFLCGTEDIVMKRPECKWPLLWEEGYMLEAIRLLHGDGGLVDMQPGCEDNSRDSIQALPRLPLVLQPQRLLTWTTSLLGNFDDTEGHHKVPPK